MEFESNDNQEEEAMVDLESKLMADLEEIESPRKTSKK